MEIDRGQLAALAAVVEAGTFEGAATALAVTPSAVSQRIKALERRTGQVLVRRARPCRPTEAGAVLVRLAGAVDLLEREAAAEVGGALTGRGAGPGAGRGHLTVPVAVNADSLSTWFPAVLAGLPDGVLVDVRRADQERSADLLRDGTVMAAVTADAAAVQGCRSRPLGAMRYLAVAAPGYAVRWFGTGADDDALAAAPMVSFDRADTLQHRFLHQVTDGRLGAAAGAAADGGRRGSAPGGGRPPEHFVPSGTAFLEVLRTGLGWGMAADVTVRRALADGSLVEVLPGEHLDVPLHWQHWRLDAPTLDDLTRRVLRAAHGVLHAVV